MENAVEITARKRPAGVWVICIYYFLTAGLSLLSLVMVYRAAAALTPQEKVHVTTLTTTDYALTIISGGLTLSAAVALFLLRRAAFPLFCVALATSMSFTILHVLTQYRLSPPRLGYVIAVTVGWAIMLAVCIYTARLRAQRILK